jgi:nitrogen fixation NifU-like protein
MTEHMPPDFGRLAEELQRMAYDNMRACYSKEVIQEWQQPQNVGRLNQPDASAVVHGQCGDTMEFCLKVVDGCIAEMTFLTDGCGPTIACGSKLTSMARGLPLGQALRLTADDLLEALGGLPEENIHCAQLAVNALRGVISEYACSHPQAVPGLLLRPSLDAATREEVTQRTGDLMRGGYH